MKKKNPALAIILPLFFNSLGLLYTTIVGGVTITLLYVVIGVFLLLSGSYEALIYVTGILHPFVILWSVLLAKEKNELIEKSETPSNEMDATVANDALIHTIIVYFLAMGVLAIVNRVNENHLLLEDFYAFYIMAVIITIIVCILPEREVKKG